MPVFTKIEEWPAGLLPQRIISVVPSITELLYDLGLEERVVGITKFCTRPAAWYQSKMRVGGTKQINLEKAISLQPDLLIANREENVADQILSLAAYTNIWLTDIKTLDDAFRMILDIGFITGKVLEASSIKEKIRMGMGRVPKLTQCYRTVYLIWKDPWMTVGGDTFIGYMLEYLGLSNLFSNKNRYPEVDFHALVSLAPELVLLSSEPFPFSQRHRDELKTALPTCRVELINGEFFSWYGSRLMHAPTYFAKCIEQWNQRV